MIDNRVTIRI